ncbi:MAG: ATP-binding protein [Bacteroidetes bacterium]|nr:ATP-binding protein [Bacteroidota bacterium]
MTELILQFPNFIPRKLYIDKTVPYIDTPVIKVLTGQRRVGKSYLLFQLMNTIREKDPDAQIVYINMELREFEQLKDDSLLFGFIKEHSRSSERTYLFIDEIQEVKHFEKAIRSLFAEGSYDIYCSGSNSHLMSGELATYLSGRYVEIQIHSLTYAEFLEFHQLENNKGSVEKYIKWGGLPAIARFPASESVIYQFIESVKDTILLKDIVQRFNVRNVSFLKNLLFFLADNLASLVSAKRISDYLKSQQIPVNVQTVLDYLGFLDSSFIVQKVRRFEIGGRKIFEVGEKYYFEDLGIRHVLTPFNRNDMSKVLENMVYHQLRAYGYQIFVGKSGNCEIDFVAQKQSSTLYFQVSLQLMNQDTINREYGNLLEIKDNFPKYLITLDEIASSDYKGIQHLQIMDFLMREW